jgi:oligopeptide/dipeptide ABC transporter ATP-binding protein
VTPLLEVDDLWVEFRTRRQTIHAVRGLSYAVEAGETLAVVGESGCGKSVSARAVMGILETPPGRIVGGAVRLRGEDLLTASERRRREVRGRHVAMVFQDPLSALNPVFTVGDQIAELYRARLGEPRRLAWKHALEMLARVGIPDPARRARDYPHQFSGGMRQRVMIGMALALQPEVLIADEPTTALDVTVQAQIMRLLQELQRELGMALILITHNLGVVAQVADRVTVVYAGRQVEEAPAWPLFQAPAMPYTRGLLAAIPRLGDRRQRLTTLPGAPPSPARIPAGCPFRPRCSFARDRCAVEQPALREVGQGHRSACHFAEEVLRAR